MLYIVREKPRTGAEVMDMMETMSQGLWRPSPGSIYPLLESMVKEGVLSLPGEGQGKRYNLTEQGVEEIEGPMGWLGKNSVSPRSVEEVLNQLTSYVSYLEDLASTQNQALSSSSSRIRDLRKRLNKLEAA